jgi:putative oxidoreductase
MSFFMSRYNDSTYALMRFITGLLFLWHGCQKLFDFPKAASEMPEFIQYGAGGIELVAGALIAIGLFTRPAAFVASGLMAVAYWMAHAPNHLFPLVNGGELASLYCFVFLYISARGGGNYSLDDTR